MSNRKLNVNVKKESGIYCIRNTKDDKKYVGSSKNVAGRITDHKRELKYNKHCNKILQNAWGKYGEEYFLFEGVEYCSEKELLNREQYYIDTWKVCDRKYGYNICKIAGTGPSYKSPEHRRKLSEAAKKRKYDPKHLEKFQKAGIKKREQLKKEGKLKLKTTVVWSIDIKTKELKKYNSITEASEINNINLEKIRCCIRGYRNSGGGVLPMYQYKGRIWKYTKKECEECLYKYLNRKPKKKVLSKKHKENISKSMRAHQTIL